MSQPVSTCRGSRQPWDDRGAVKLGAMPQIGVLVGELRDDVHEVHQLVAKATRANWLDRRPCSLRAHNPCDVLPAAGDPRVLRETGPEAPRGWQIAGRYFASG